jgi:hypothetical protein
MGLTSVKTRMWGIASAAILLIGASFLLFSRLDLGSGLPWRRQSADEQIKRALYPCLAESHHHGASSSCLEQRLPELFRKFGPAATLAVFDTHVSQAGEVFALHQAAHHVGKALFTFTGGDVEKAFALCTTAAHNGCQHALFGELAKTGTLKDVPHLCHGNKKRGAERLCFHGIGHALLVERQGELVAALVDCDALAIPDGAKRACWSGVFMENGSNLMGGGHRYIKTDDPLYPCTMAGLDEKYVRTCYHQVAMPQGLRDGFAVCRTAPTKWQADCGIGLGIRAGAFRTHDTDWLIATCRLGGADLGVPCLQGALGYLRVSDDPARIVAYCAKLAEGERAAVCKGASPWSALPGSARPT